MNHFKIEIEHTQSAHPDCQWFVAWYSRGEGRPPYGTTHATQVGAIKRLREHLNHISEELAEQFDADLEAYNQNEVSQ